MTSNRERKLSIQALRAAIVVGCLLLVLTCHRFSEHILFIGDSNDVSRVVGIAVDREKIEVFTPMGFFACAAIVLTLENENFSATRARATC